MHRTILKPWQDGPDPTKPIQVKTKPTQKPSGDWPRFYNLSHLRKFCPRICLRRYTHNITPQHKNNTQMISHTTRKYAREVCANTLYRLLPQGRVWGSTIASCPHASKWLLQLPTVIGVPSERYFLPTESLHRSIKNLCSLFLVRQVGLDVKLLILQSVRSIWHVLLQHGDMKYRMYDWQTWLNCKMISYLADLSEHPKQANIMWTQLVPPPKAYTVFSR